MLVSGCSPRTLTFYLPGNMELSIKMVLKFLLLFSLGVMDKAGGESSTFDPLSTHVLDTSTGRPGVGIPFKLHKEVDSRWNLIFDGKTNEKGRATNLVQPEQWSQGKYKIRFETLAYFSGQSFYPYIEIMFIISNTDEHYHVPIVVTPYGYSTYRGS